MRFPLLSATLCVLVRRARWAWAVATLTAWSCFAGAFVILNRVLDYGDISYAEGGWQPPWGIELHIDLLNALSKLMGWRQSGVRLTVQVPDEKGQLARVAATIGEAGGLLAGGGAYPSPEPLKARIVFKVRNLTEDDLLALLEGMEGIEILDIRESPYLD